MQYGLFTMPSHPPERGLFEGHRWDLQTLRWADELGFTEAWIGEHHTAPWEPHPSPDLLIAQALMETRQHPARPGRVSAALSPPGRAGEPRRDARPHGAGQAQFRRRGERSAERLGDVQCRRQRRAAPRDDARGARHHPQAVDRGGTVRLRRQILEGDQDRPDAAHIAAAYPAVAETIPADRRRRRQQGLGHLEARRRARVSCR